MSWVANVMVSVNPADRRNVEALSEWLRSDAPLQNKASGGCGFLSETTGGDSAWGGWKSPECTVYAGALNHADLRALLERVRGTAWRVPNALQLFIMDQEQSYFRLWMLRDGRVQQYAPTHPDEDTDAFYPDDYMRS
ncbi:hypothetical protein [Actinomadura rupiterrae]|uniref:hypothetical protein n=1 Tax=Actinomadura rupiterrae TaxID=559627 RepID=UPI0020A2A53C|nr:hypothetical protein [Actinomadura rupiterrae]MCP2337628.1 hypothetical protein [Actinomadura rupiterrae]